MISICNLCFHGTRKKYGRRFALTACMKITAPGREKHEAADGGATWTLHFLCFPLSAFCHLFHSPNQKALQGQAVQQSRWTYGIVITRTQSVSSGRHLTVFSSVGLAATKKLESYQVSPAVGCWSDAPETLTMKSSLGCLLESKTFKSFELL